ncbi:hypothetical protein CONPUDRAFT_161980 [Coniophora puteana RWD-64-598 SS2]|uniref:TPR-like protein n=1 Tax=Coniophora puteana (strain RWD-64-598) TaxID=741705 RepID=A0A5M3N7N4_CONPW|nr:uncharacterized protein CONPUDRAFT_161980 [Coniophora puteana RWD-64-598 SS2]EIW87452.1 hypothetical protein CONPUDRAFT_161980 [Coniophora puteana RWD-64-598 SS2]
MALAEIDARPFKRQRTDEATWNSSPLTPLPSSSPAKPPLSPLPPHALLTWLPGIFVHTPNHRHHTLSLSLSLRSLRRCLALKALTPDVECWACTALAEVGMRVIAGGFSQQEEHLWAKGVELEVEKALGKGSLLAQKHPSLRAYRHHLSLLSAQFAQWQHNFKFARSVLRRLISSFTPSDPPHTIYSAHLAIIDQLTCAPSPQAQDLHAALDAVSTLQTLGTQNKHPHLVLLAHVIKLRICVAFQLWDLVPEALGTVESALGLVYPAPSAPVSKSIAQAQGVQRTDSGTSSNTSAGAGGPSASQSQSQAPNPNIYIHFEDTFELAMVLHVLILAVMYYTHLGDGGASSSRLSHLHALMDSGATDKFPEGIIEISLPDSRPLALHITHPRTLYVLTFLVSSTSKRDPVGRKPKRKVFATEGLGAWNREVLRELKLPVWASVDDIGEIDQRLVRIKADMLSELAAVSIQRSEFDLAQETLNTLIAHTRTFDIFNSYASRITLHHAHLAHALGNFSRAIRCYEVAAHLEPEPTTYVAVAARTGEVLLRIGLAAAKGSRKLEESLRQKAVAAARSCKGMGGTLEAIGEVIEATLASEILKSKTHLKNALALTKKSTDNHLRALVLALISAHYMHTAPDHAQDSLLSAEQLAAGLGAAPSRDASANGQDAVGNAPLRYWIGERLLELFKRAGKEGRVQRQTVANEQLAKEVEKVAQIGSAFFTPS